MLLTLTVFICKKSQRSECGNFSMMGFVTNKIPTKDSGKQINWFEGLTKLTKIVINQKRKTIFQTKQN